MESSPVMAFTEKIELPSVVVLWCVGLALLLDGVDGERFGLALLLDGVHRVTGETETVGVVVMISNATFAGL